MVTRLCAAVSPTVIAIGAVAGVLNAIDDLAANMAGDRTYYHAQPLGWLGEF